MKFLKNGILSNLTALGPSGCGEMTANVTFEAYSSGVLNAVNFDRSHCVFFPDEVVR
jgi:hypothetical protein